MINLIAESLAAHAVEIDDLKPASRNARLHPSENLEDIKQSISAFGQDQLIVARRDNHEIIKGNGRWLAMKELGWTQVAAIFVDDDEIKAMARAIADNHASDTSINDDNILAAELQKLLDTEWADATGYSEDEIQQLVADFIEETTEETEAREMVDETRAAELQIKWQTEEGQLWRMGQHYLMIGDSVDPQVVANLMQGEKFAVCFTDPPYGIKYDTTSTGRSARKWKDIKNDGLNESELEDFCRGFLGNLFRYGMHNWAGYICFANATDHVLRNALVSLNIRMSAVPIIWVKQHFALNWDRYHPQHEIIRYCGPGSVPTATSDISRWHGERNESTVWNIDRDSPKAMEHPTQKPVELPERAIKNSSTAGEIILDLFGGSGATLVAAHIQKRKGRAVELDTGYAAVILERMAKIVDGDVEKVEVKPYPVPEGPDMWQSRFFRMTREQAATVDQALRMISKTLKGDNATARALEMMAADFLAGHPEQVIDRDVMIEERHGR